MGRQRGFTLIELMIVVAVVAILAAIAYPMYIDQIRKGRRAEAKQIMIDWSLRQEKWRVDHATYGTLINIGASSNATTGTSPNNFYSVVVSTPSGNCPNGTAATSGNSFRFTATPINEQAGDSDCASMVYSSLCGEVQKTATDANGLKCW